MNRIVFFITSALTAVYVALSIMGIAGVSNEAGGFAYRLITIAALIYACSRLFASVVTHPAASRHPSEEGNLGADNTLFAAALGLGTFAVNEIYVFAYIYLLKGSAEDVTVGNYSRNCVYLFFIAAVFFLLPKIGKALRICVSILSAGAAFLIFTGVVTDNAKMLYYSALTLMLLCVLSAAVLLKTGGKDAKILALSIIAVSVLDSANRLLLLYNPGWHWRDIVLAFYPAVYLIIGAASMRLKPSGKEAEQYE